MPAIPSHLAQPPFHRVAVVVNPATRFGAAEIIAILQDVTPPTTKLDVQLTAAPGEAIRLARAAVPAADLVVAAGGDGTVADVATGILGSGTPLGIIPTGSTNIVARELGIPRGPRDAARLLFSPHRLARIDVGRHGDRVFLHMAGAGFDSRFFARADRNLKRRVGWVAYLPAAIASLRLPPSRFTIIADGRETAVTSPLVVVANGSSIITPALHLHPKIRFDDGWLDVLAFTATAPEDIALTIAQVATMTLDRSSFLFNTRAREVTLHAEPPLPVQLDGDVVDPTPATFSVEPAALAIVAPAKMT